MSKTKTTEAVETTNVHIGTGHCACGCGEYVGKASFRPGHDARLVGQLADMLRITPDTPTAADEDVERVMSLLPSLALRAKLARSIASREAKATAARDAADKKAADAARDMTATRQAAKAALDDELAATGKLTERRSPRARKAAEVVAA
jgi:hypothetical protein